MGVTQAHDLQALRGMPLKKIHFDATPIHISPLADSTSLEEIILPRTVTDLDAIRNLPNLKWISYDVDIAMLRPSQTAAQFWREYDAREPAPHVKP